MAQVLLLAEHNADGLNAVTAKALTAALAMGDSVHVLVAGHDCRAAAEQAAALGGVAKVLLADDAAYAHFLAEPVAALVVSLAGAYSAIVAPSSANMKNVLPRVAALLDCQLVSDIMEVKAPDTFLRGIYAGNALQTVQSRDAIRIVTVRTASFATAPGGGSASIEAVAVTAAGESSRFVAEELAKSDRPELTGAKIVVSGGRALGSAENFKALLEPLADSLGAAVGASRAAVDAGYAPNDWQVGQTGKVVAPDLYVAIGISGAIQHLAGMKDAKVIVAINKDEEAPIFQIADYGLVADLFTAVPEVSAAIGKLGK